MNNLPFEKVGFTIAAAIIFCAESQNTAARLFRTSPKFIALFLLLLLTTLAPAVEIQAANSKNKSGAKVNSRRTQPKQVSLWREISENNLATQEKRQTTPEKYRVFRLDQKSLQNSLTRLPLENTLAAEENPLILEIPMPDGKIVRFRIEETEVLAPHLTAEFPSWKTFKGFGVDEPAASARFDWNALGFHGYISTREGIVMIDPYQKGETDDYLVFYKHDYGNSDNGFYCRTEDKIKNHTESLIDSFAPAAPAFSFGTTVRTYKLAIATTGEWARNAAGYNNGMSAATIRTNALAVITTAVNRLNGIYERELSSKFMLVNPSVLDNSKNIVFDDPAVDPYNNTDQAVDDPPKVDQLRVNQETLTQRVTSAGYDIGHLFGTGGGGVATAKSLCYDPWKGQGYSARATLTGDPFVVDYVAHEIGHQFGASHTYNTLDPSDSTCSTRNTPTAVEPASGSTIMSYVGICSARNLQQYVDTLFPAFHTVSLTEMINHINEQSGCGTAAGSNIVPTVAAGNSYTIPKLTPFTLAAIASDGDDSASNLLYSWEQADYGRAASGPVGNPQNSYDDDSFAGLRPLFRSYSPVSANSRTFPSLVFILNPNTHNDSAADVNGVRSNQPKYDYTGTHPTGAPGAVCESSVTCVIGERLPTINRTMNFRVSVRDRRGGIADAGTTVTVAEGAGPFQVTTQNSTSNLAPQATWQVNSAQTVTWDVANTSAAPISVASVKILLSTDGGQTFPFTLAETTPNDGTEQINIPSNAMTSTARIKVEAVGNIFFDINNANFAIAAPTAASVNVTGRVLSARGKGIARATVTLTDQNGMARTARTNAFGYYNFADIYVGQTYIFTVSSKGYQFEPRFVSLTDGIEQLNFIAQ